MTEKEQKSQPVADKKEEKAAPASTSAPETAKVATPKKADEAKREPTPKKEEPKKETPKATVAETQAPKVEEKKEEPKTAAPQTRRRHLTDVDFANLHQELKKIKSPTGETLFDHIKKVFQVLMMHRPEEALARFEEVSTLIKQKKNLDDFLRLTDTRSYKGTAEDAAAYNSSVKQLFEKAIPDEEGNIPQAEPLNSQIQDLSADARIFQWAGVGFGEQETFRLQKSLKKLAQAKPYASIRFFGKIYGTERDYYVVECEGGEFEEEAEAGAGEEAEAAGEPDPKLEGKGTGVNEVSYLVTSDSMSEWTKLPDLSYKDINAARQIKVLFTGNLNRYIFTNPYFFGQEKHYLRAQLSRISHSTSLYPKGQYRKPEEDETGRAIELNQPEEGELVLPTTSDMAKVDMWVHAKPNILINGRTTHLDPEEPADLPEGEEFDPEEAKRQIEAADPYETRLKPIQEDERINIAGGKVTASIRAGGQTTQPWSVRLHGDTMEYANPKDEFKSASAEGAAQNNPSCSNGVVVVRSLVWPGAYTFYYERRVVQIYLGHGHKFTQESSQFPSCPPKVNADPKEYEEQPEPTPLNEPAPKEEPVEGDDAEKGEGEGGEESGE